jgi:hypothetical protein
MRSASAHGRSNHAATSIARRTSPLARLLRRVRRRLRLQRSLDALGLWGVIGLTLVGPGVIRLRLFGARDRLGLALCALGLSLPLLAAGAAALRRLSLSRVAAELDRALQLRELLGSAWEFAAVEPVESRFRRATIARAQTSADDLQPRRLAALRLSRLYWAWPWLGLGLLASARLQPMAATASLPPTAAKSTPHAFRFETAAALAALAAEPSAPGSGEVNALEAELAELIDLLRRDAIEPLELLRRLQAFDQRAARALVEPRRALAETRALGADLRVEPASREFGAALAEADFTRASVTLQDLARRAGGAPGNADVARFREAVREALARREQAQRARQKRQLDSLERERAEVAKSSAAGSAPAPSVAEASTAHNEASPAPAADGGGSTDQLSRRLQDLARARAEAGRALDAVQRALAPLERAQLERRSLERLESRASELRRVAAAHSAEGSAAHASENPRALSLSRFARQAQAGPAPAAEQANGLPERPDTTRQAERSENKQDATSGAPDDAKGGAVLGQPSASSPTKKDTRVLGRGEAGPTRNAVIHIAADSGFSGGAYRRVHADYLAHAESELEREDLPPGYRAYVRRYFLLIRPREETR